MTAASATLQLAGQWKTYRSRLALQAQVANEQHLCINIVPSAQGNMPSQSGTSNEESSAWPLLAGLNHVLEAQCWHQSAMTC